MPSNLCSALTEMAEDNVTGEKWLIAPTRRAGHQWLRSAALHGAPCINCRVVTTETLAMDVLKTRSAEDSRVYLKGELGPFFVAQAWNRCDDLSYLDHLESTSGLFENIWSTIQDLRLAGVEAADVTEADWDVEGKRADIAALMQAYEEVLCEREFFDRADLFDLAGRILREDNPFAPRDYRLLLPGDMETSGLEETFLNSFPPQRVRYLPVDRPIDDGDAETTDRTEEGDLGLLRWLGDTVNAPSPSGDDSVRMFRAAGEINELREVIRRCHERGWPLDDVELLYTSREPYGHLLHELMETSQHKIDLETDEDRWVTFAEGISAACSRPGRALKIWLDCQQNDYPQADLVRMIEDGLVKVEGLKDSDHTQSSLARVFRSIVIKAGGERYHRRLTEEMHNIRHQLDTWDEGKSGLQYRLEACRLLRDTITSLIDSAPDSDDAGDLIRSSREFLNSHARSVSELDENARQGMIERLEELQESDVLPDHDLDVDMRQWVMQLPDQERVLGSAPRPGCLHAAPISSGGHSGRPHTFIVGLDDAQFPGRGQQDPMVLDEERKELSDQLSTSGERLNEREADFRRLLARLRGTVTLSYSSYDMLEDDEKFPSPVLMDVYWLLARPDGENIEERSRSLDDFLDFVDGPVAFVPSESEGIADVDRWVLNHLCQHGTNYTVEELWADRFPHLIAGQRLVKARKREAFGEYDGFVPGAGRDMDPFDPDGVVLSSSGLEKMGACPLRFFFRYALGLEEPDEIEMDPHAWLDALEKGTFVHELFADFMETLADEERGLTDGDIDRMKRELEDKLRATREKIPPPSELVYQRERRDLRKTTEILLSRERDRSGEARPEYLEARIGLKLGNDPKDIETDDPVRMTLGKGKSIRVRGMVDRIDRRAPFTSHKYEIIDYKTGSTWKYRQDPPLWEGRVLQPYIYLQMVNKRLREEISSVATADRFHYFFVSDKGKGQLIGGGEEKFSEARDVIRHLCTLMADGCFLHTEAAEHDCTFCEFKPICQHEDQLEEWGKAKLRNAANTMLQPM
ncbi:MAG: PD-(D/E)XK nuclease family protein, partial [Planctomycetota bacterium]